MMGFRTPYPKVLHLGIEHFKLKEFEKTRNKKEMKKEKKKGGGNQEGE